MRAWIFACGFLGATAVALGAYGAHALVSLEDAAAAVRLQTAVAYHFYHVAALLCVTVLTVSKGEHLALRISRWLFLTGILCFSGSLYWLTLIGPIAIPGLTPLGGLLLIGAWLALAAYAFRSHRTA